MSVAVPLDRAKFDDRPYAFLPMGPDAHGPIAGHINAPFAIRLARDFLVSDVPLNDFLHDEAAALCAEIATQLRDHPAASTVIPDLIAWRAPDHSRIAAAFAASGRALSTAELIPVLGGDGWDSLDAAYEWDWPGHEHLSAASLTRTAGAVFVDPALAKERLERIEGLTRPSRASACNLRQASSQSGRRHMRRGSSRRRAVVSSPRLDRDERLLLAEMEKAAGLNLREAHLPLDIVDQEVLDLADILAVLVLDHPRPDVVIGCGHGLAAIVQSAERPHPVCIIAVDRGPLGCHG